MDKTSSISSVENRVYLIRSFEFDLSLQAQDTLDAFSSLSQAQMFSQLGGNAGNADKWVWETLSGKEPEEVEDAIKTAEKEIHADLYPVVRRILIGRNEPMAKPKTSVFQGTPPLRLKSGVISTQFLLPLEQGSVRRLENQAPDYAKAKHIPLKLHDFRVYLIGRGFGLLVWEFAFVNPFVKDQESTVPAEVICEGTTLLCRAYEGCANLIPVKLEKRKSAVTLKTGQAVQLNGQYQLIAEEETNLAKSGLMLNDCAQGQSGLAAFTHPIGGHDIRDWMEAMIPSEASIHKIHGNHVHQRLFSYTVVQVPDLISNAEATTLSYRLAHKYTSDYEIPEEDIGASTIRPFNNIVHAMATQGGAVVVRDNGTGFIRQFVTFAAKTTYLPLTLLAYHEYLSLRALTEYDLHPTTSKHLHDELEENLINFQKEISDFRLHYRFSHVSDLSNHNRVFHQWRNILKLDEMLLELTQDATESERVLNSIRQHRQEKDRFLFSAVSALAIFLLLGDLAELITKLFVLPPVKTAHLFEKFSDLLDKPAGTSAFNVALNNFREELSAYIDRLHTAHQVEEALFFLALIILAFAVRFVLRHRKSPIGIE